jgi:hypothetical protein
MGLFPSSNMQRDQGTTTGIAIFIRNWQMEIKQQIRGPEPCVVTQCWVASPFWWIALWKSENKNWLKTMQNFAEGATLHECARSHLLVFYPGPLAPEHRQPLKTVDFLYLEIFVQMFVLLLISSRKCFRRIFQSILVLENVTLFT